MISQHSINVTRLDTGEERNTFTHWHMMPATELSFQPPEPKYVYEETGGVDGSLDETENAADRVLYNNRTGSWEFYITNRADLQPNIDSGITWADMQSDLSNFLHGQKCKIQFEDDPNYYYIGRLKISGFDPNKHYQHVTIDYDVEPYKYELDEFDSGTLSVSTTSTLTSYGSPMPAIPKITINSSKFAFNQKAALTRGEAVWMLYNFKTYTRSGHEQYPPVETTSFLDVSEDDYYYESVVWAQYYGITSGVTEYIFGGENVCTRAMFIQMLWKTVGSNERNSNIPFTDVKINAYYYNAVKWAWYHQLIAGDGNGHFMPNEPMTRQHACAILYKCADEPSFTDTSDFTDLEGTEQIYPWYYLAVIKLNNMGYVSGYSDGTFRPANYVTRGQFIQMIYASAGEPMESITYPWTDIPDNLHNAAMYVYSHGIASGTSATEFSPDRTMERKEMIQMLYQYGNYRAISNTNLDYWNMTGLEDQDDSALSGYEVASDVHQSDYYYIAVAWGVVHDITTLDSGHRFNPDQKSTRAMAAQMLFKLCKILEGWTDTAETIVPTAGGGSSTELNAYTGSWTQGYYSSLSESFITDSAYLRSDFISVSSSSRTGVSNYSPQGTKWKAHWFSNADASSFISESSWQTGGSRIAVDKPNSARYCVVSVQAQTQENINLIADEPWFAGELNVSDGTIVNPSSENSYRTGYIDVRGIDYLHFGSRAEGYSFAVSFYDTNGQFLMSNGWYTGQQTWSHSRGSAVYFPTATAYIRCSVSSTDDTMAQSELSNFFCTGDSTDTPSAEDIYLFTVDQVDATIFSDIVKYSVDYSEAIRFCYSEDIIDAPMCEYAPMTVRLANDKIDKTTEVAYGQNDVPELTVYDGENDWTVTGTGTYRIQYKRGSL